MDSYIGRLLDNRYEILEIIGTGGMAVVYKARDHRLKRLVAVKILKDEFSQDEEFRRRFNAESQAVAMLSHPNIVSVYDVNTNDGVNFIVMELIDGITLKQYMERRGQLNWRETLHFGIQITKALEHAHGRGIIHRDIKPHNIMLLKDGSVKVADFGIARMTSAQNTLTREALGSVHYISPEQAKGGKVDCRSDLYSLGVVMYEMMTSKPPFDGDTPDSVAIQNITGTPQPPHELNPEVPKGLEQITMHAMTSDLAHRYASASDILADLEEFRKNPAIAFNFETPGVNVPPVVPVPPVNRPVPGKPAGTTRPVREPVKHDLREVYGEKEPATEKNGSKKTTVIVAIVALLVVLGAAYLLFTMFLKDILFGSAGSSKVPQFVGMSYEDIYPSDYPEFEFELKEWVYDDEYARGYVVEQSPEGETEVVASEEQKVKIYLTLSMGPESTDMPVLTDMLVENATRMLNDMNLGLNIKLENLYSSDFEKGVVINSNPVAGVELKEGDTVTLYVSLGEETEETPVLTPVPNLVDEKLSTAKTLLENADLSLGEVREVESDKPAGTVIWQSIASGQEVEPGTMIDLQISFGSEEEEETEEPEDSTEPEAPTEQEPSTEPETPNESDPSMEPDTPNEPEAPELSRQKVTIYLPEQVEGGPETVQVTLTLDGVQVVDEAGIPLADEYVNAELNGVGSMTLDVYFDGVWAYNQTVVFD